MPGAGRIFREPVEPKIAEHRGWVVSRIFVTAIL
jgi:hypothetical protein